MANVITGGWKASKDSKWNRPALPKDWEKNAIIFQVVEMDQERGAPLPGMPGHRTGEVTIIRLYGVTRLGQSVLVHAHGFVPYLYVKAPSGFNITHCENFKKHCNRMLEGVTKGIDPIVNIEIQQKNSIQDYQFGRFVDFLKIVVQQPSFVPKVRQLFEKGVSWPVLPALESTRTFSTYESNVPFELRFMIDNDYSGAPWLKIEPGKFSISKPFSLCQIEVDVSYADIIPLKAEGDYMKIAPFRILSFDIECQGRKGQFPTPEQDSVIQIANYVVQQGDPKPIIKNVFCLQSCSNIVGADVLAFEKEEDMLMAWKQFLCAVDPDILTGYNVINFDMPYLLDRAATLRLHEFPYWSRLQNVQTRMKDAHFQSKAHGHRDYKEINVEGRVQLDVLVVIQREHKLRSYSLNAVATHFLQEQKEDVHHSIISDLQNGDEETRRRLAVYCLKDAYLPLRLIDKLMIVVNLVEMARVTGVTINQLMTRGQQIKVFSQILRKARTKMLLFPTYESGGATDGVSYEGATVIDPIRGFHNCPVTTLDFASLYPSIMMAHNLCYSTLLRKAEVPKLPADDYTKSPSGDCFVKKTVYKGILPEILEELLSARKEAKKLMAVATDPMEKAVYNGRQLALKISANSVYGFTGATVGKLPCLEISSSVTGFGRQMIHQTKELVEAKFTKANGYDHDAIVLYGDTDSVMVKFGYDDLPTAMKMGKEAADYVSATFIKPIKLEFEKVYFPYLLMNKKRYAGLLHTKPDTYDYLDCKGIESVRRDNCPLVKNMVQNILNKILIDRSVESAIGYAKQTITDLLMNRLDISHLVISKSVSKSAEEYGSKQAHVELVERMKKRDAATAPGIGDRVPFVIIKGVKGAKAYEKSEDPIYVLENNIPIDVTYYLEQQLGPPLERLFEGLLDNPKKTLLQGEHTRSIAVATPSKAVGGIMKFAKVTLTCLNCKCPLPNGTAGNKALCPGCSEKSADIYARILAKRNNFERLYARVWTQCQRCQGSLHQDVLCTSRDCPVFYMRKKVQKDLKEQQEQLDRFGSIDW
jgi:DNA polymerase delta subunit 1